MCLFCLADLSPEQAHIPHPPHAHVAQPQLHRLALIQVTLISSDPTASGSLGAQIPLWCFSLSLRLCRRCSRFCFFPLSDPGDWFSLSGYGNSKPRNTSLFCFRAAGCPSATSSSTAGAPLSILRVSSPAGCPLEGMAWTLSFLAKPCLW